MANLDTILSQNLNEDTKRTQTTFSTQDRKELYLKDGDSLYITGIQDDMEQQNYFLMCKMSTWRTDEGKWVSRFNHDSVDMSDVPPEASTRSRLLLWVYVHYMEHKNAQNRDGSWRYGADSWEKIPVQQTKNYIYREQLNEYKIVELPYSLKDAIIDSIQENDSRLDKGVFKLSRTGEGLDTRYNFGITRREMEITDDKKQEQKTLVPLETYFLEKNGISQKSLKSKFDFSNPFEKAETDLLDESDEQTIKEQDLGEEDYEELF